MALKTTWRHVRRSPYQALAAILTTSLMFFVISIFCFVIIGSSQVISYFESVPKVTAFFKEEAKQEEIDKVKKQLEDSGKIAKMSFVSKEQAVKIYKEQNKDDPLLLEFVTADILPSSLEVSTTKIEHLQSVYDLIKKSAAVENVVYQKDVISKLTSWTSAIRKIGIAFVIVQIVNAVLIMMTFIGIKISQKREEIEILRLIGATYWYIRWPFIIEGIFYGVFGAFWGWAFSALALLYVNPFLLSFLKGVPVTLLSTNFLLGLLAANILLAFSLGVFSSFLAVLRYLK